MKKTSKIILFLILLLSLLLRVYKFRDFYVFSHDQDLASWIIKDILVNGHLRLIGQETSSQGVFIGALFYYMQIPFYLIGKMSPLPAVFLTIILGVLTTFSSFFVMSKITNSQKAGLIAGLIHASSALIVFIDREVAPTMPVILWSVWYLYSLFLIYRGNQIWGFVLWGFLLGLVWHFNLALIILAPLILVPLIFLKKESKSSSINAKAVILGLLVLLVCSSPLVIFEIRHGFSQTRAVTLSLTTQKDFIEGTSTGLAKLDRVMQLVNRNSISIFSKYFFTRPSFIFWGLVVLFFYLVKRKKISPFLITLVPAWQLTYILFFSLVSLNVSEYYFHGMNIIWILIVSLGLLELLNSKKKRSIFFVLASLFLISNIYYIYNFNSDKKGYVQKVELVKKIKSDSLEHRYPCISISYITNPGYDLGYRYLFWLEDMHVNRPNSRSPVYSIVFPHSLVDSIDESFGSLGLIYPDYKRYNEEKVKLSCMGENANETDPMLGFTQ